MEAPGREWRGSGPGAPPEAMLWAEFLLAIAILLVAGSRLLPEEELPAPGAGPRFAAVIDVNESPWYELIYLPGIGSVRAREIVRLREASGPFGTLEDLRRVRGIGPATVSRIRAFLAGTSNGHSDR